MCTDAGGAFYSCAALSGSYDIGSFFGPAKDTGNNMLDQVVVPVSAANLAIGKLQEVAPNGATQVLLHVKGVLPLGGVS